MIQWNEPFYPTSEPRENIPEELKSSYLALRSQADWMNSRKKLLKEEKIGCPHRSVKVRIWRERTTGGKEIFFRRVW